ncbi:Ig-like domain-containing protein [Desulforamulus ruminis]|uniref:Ig-like domain-containing protein n=1 Tax=Desulforamulus ruminis TaxID=1564 RepID=UPI002FD9A4D9
MKKMHLMLAVLIVVVLCLPITAEAATPTTSITSPMAGQTFYKDDNLDLQGTSTDTDGGNTVTLRYTITPQGSSTPLANHNNVFLKSYVSGGILDYYGKRIPIKREDFPGEGNYTIHLNAVDSTGSSATEKTVNIHVVPNRTPVASISTTGQLKASPIPGHEIITLSGKVYDLDGDGVTISATLGGIAKSMVVNPAPTNVPGSNNWTLTWMVSTDSVPQGLYNSIPVTFHDGFASSTVNYTGGIVVDWTPPIVNQPTLTVNSTNQITVAPNASDPQVSGVIIGLDPTPYLYQRNGGDVGSWQNGSWVDSGLQANTLYIYRYKARDALGNVSNYSSEAGKYTLALDPTELTVAARANNALTFDITGDAGNGTPPSYRLEVKLKGAGAGGTAMSVSDFSTATTRVLTGLTQGTEYEVWCITRNGDNVDNSAVKMMDSVTTNSPPVLTVPQQDQYRSAVPGHEIITLSGKVHDLDGDQVTISATINGVTKSTAVNPAPTSTPGSDNWTLTWNVAEDGIPEGAYTGMAMTATDGICTEVIQNFTGKVVVDLTAPSDPIITVTPPGWTHTDATVTISNILDVLSGVDYLAYSTDGGETLQTQTGTGDVSVTLVATGQHGITAKIVDNAGNESNIVTASAYIDKVAPIITFDGITDGNTYYTPVTPSYSMAYSISGKATETTTVTKDGQPYEWSKDESITEAGSYALAVEATDQAGNTASATCQFEVALPQVPQAPILTPLSSAEIQVDWAAVSGGDGYKVIREESEIADTNQLNYIDAGLTPNTSYRYRIDSYNPVGTSSGPEQVGVTHANVPSSLQIANITPQGLSLQWAANGNPDGTEYLAGCTETTQESGWMTATRFDFAGLSSDQSYTLWVKARNLEGVETVTASVYGTIAAPALPDVTVGPGDDPGTTEIVIPEAPAGTHYEYIVQPNPFLPPPAVGEIFGGTVFTPPVSVPVTPGIHLGIALCDDATGGVIQFTERTVTLPDISTLDHIVVTPDPLLIPHGLTQQLTVMAHYTGGSVIDVTNISTYASDNEMVATVTDTGLVSTLARGDANITVTYDVQTVVLPLGVDQPVAVGLGIRPSLTEINQGSTQQFIAELGLSNGETADVTNTAIWNTSDPTVAAVNQGLVTGLSGGTVFISVSDSSQIALLGLQVKTIPSSGGGGSVETDPPELPPVVEPPVEEPPVETPVFPPAKPEEPKSDNKEVQAEPEPNPQPQPQPKESPSIRSNEPTEKMGTIYGRVLEANGRPLAGILVELHSTVRTTYTDANGYYKFEKVEPGEHHLYLRDKDQLIELASAKIVVLPGMNRIESTFGNRTTADNVKVQVRAEATGEQVDFIISEEKLALIRPAEKIEEPPKTVEKILATAAVAVTVAGGGLGMIYLSLLPARRKYNVLIKTQGKPTEKHKIQAQRIVILNLTETIRKAKNPITIQFRKNLLKQLSNMESTIVLRYENTDMAIYRISESKIRLSAEIDINSFETKWIE